MIKYKAGYEYLLAYKITVPIYDYTVTFCTRHRSQLSSLRTYDQMIQAARSGMQNIPEGNKQQSLAGYIKLTGVSRGSFEELLNDFLTYARQHHIRIWDKDRVNREIWESREIWRIIKSSPTLPTNPAFPPLPTTPEKEINLLISLIKQANYLIDRLIVSLKNKHMKEGGFQEKLLKKRLEYRFSSRHK